MGKENGATSKLYVRFPCKIEEELQVKNLHPKISTVILPRQKSRRWCFVVLPNQETLQEVQAKLRETKINGKKLVVKRIYQDKLSRKKTPVSAAPPNEALIALLKDTTEEQ